MHWGTISLITVKSELVLCVVGLNILSYLHWPTALLFTLGIVSRIFVFRHVNGFTRCTRDTDYQSECVLQRHVFCRTNVNIKWTRIGFALRNYKKKTLAKSLLRTLFSIWLALCWLKIISLYTRDVQKMAVNPRVTILQLPLPMVKRGS